MRAQVLRGFFVLGMFTIVSHGSALAQTTNPDYTYMVLRYMTAPSIGEILSLNDVPVRIGQLNVPDSLATGEVGVFGVEANIETASVPFRAGWQFGDGSVASGLVATHAYEAPGRYEVRLVLENASGRTSRRHTVTVLAAAR